MEVFVNRRTLAMTIAGVLLATSMSTIAQARPSTRSFTCEALKDYIYDRGAVVMNHKNASLYRRFVANASYCRNYGGSTKRFTVPTRSGPCTLRICHEPLDWLD